MTTTARPTSAAIALRAALCVLALMATGTAFAAQRPKLTGSDFMQIDAMVLAAKGRPNEESRLRGLKSYQNGDDADAVSAFERGALYADKFSQHYLSLLYWHGVGVARDPVQAYIWSDLAAERGARPLLAIRENMWSMLTPEQREQAKARGPALFDRYGDEHAKPRVEHRMRQFARKMTGSRLGYRNQRLEISGPPVNGSFTVATGSNAAAYFISDRASPDDLYGPDGGLARLETYWRQQDRLIDARVRVGALEQVRE